MVTSEGLAKKRNETLPFLLGRRDANPDNYEQKVYLYREFQSEVLRILIPATTLEWNETVKQTFIAAVMLGLKETFGSVEHLKATVTEEPAPGNEYRKNYHVLYDSVPGGTGYLKHLSKTPDAIFDMLDKCLRVLVKCECASQPKRDGCYRCLFAYKQAGIWGRSLKSGNRHPLGPLEQSGTSRGNPNDQRDRHRSVDGKRTRTYVLEALKKLRLGTADRALRRYRPRARVHPTMGKEPIFYRG